MKNSTCSTPTSPPFALLTADYVKLKPLMEQLKTVNTEQAMSNNVKLILLFDADGCILTNNLCEKQQRGSTDDDTCTVDNLWDSHPRFWAPIAELIYEVKPNSIEILSASHRYSHALDRKYGSANKTGLFFPILLQMAEILKHFTTIDVRLDKTLLPDLIFNKPLSLEFENSPPHEDALIKTESTKHSPQEKSKLVLIYALLQHLAKKHGPNDNLKVFLYDAHIETIEKLNAEFNFFSSDNSCIIPKNITLNLFHYDGSQKPQKKYTILGKGNINPLLSETLKDISLEIALFEAHPKNHDDQASNYQQHEEIRSKLTDIHRQNTHSESMPHYFDSPEPSVRFNTTIKAYMEMDREFSPIVFPAFPQATINSNIDNPILPPQPPTNSPRHRHVHFFNDAIMPILPQETETAAPDNTIQTVIPETEKVENACCWC